MFSAPNARVALLALTMLPWSLSAAETAVGPPASAGQAAEAPRTAPLRIVVVHWKIKPGQEAEFLEYWGTRSVVEDRSGLVGEYLSSVEDRARAPWITWQALSPAYTSYFNVGIWRDVEAFQSQIGRFIDNSRPPLQFEAERRERIFLVPERWRTGRTSLPSFDPQGVK